LLVIMTASFGYLFEHEAQPDKFDNIPNAIYWAVITLASVGYGDISPVTTMGRLVTVVMALMGIGIFAIPAALLASAFSDELRKEREQLRNNLYKMLKDGKLDENEAKVLREEARRLHLTVEEVNCFEVGLGPYADAACGGKFFFPGTSSIAGWKPSAFLPLPLLLLPTQLLAQHGTSLA